MGNPFSGLEDLRRLGAAIPADAVFLLRRHRAAALLLLPGRLPPPPDSRLLACELRHVVLPDAFGKHLCRHEWSDPRIPMPAEDLLEGARLAGWTDADGPGVMDRIVAAVDRAIASPDERAGWPPLEEACRIFNEEWRTGSWDFALRIFPSLEAVMRDVTGVEDGEIPVEDPDDPDDLGLLFRRCFEDPEANRKLRDYLR